MRRWNSLMPQGGLACSGHALQTTYARTTAMRPTIKTETMVSITSIYTNAQDAPQGIEMRDYHTRAALKALTRIATDALLDSE